MHGTQQALTSLLSSLSSVNSLRHGEQLHAQILKSFFLPITLNSPPFSLLSSQLISFYSRFSLPLLSLRFFLSLPSFPPPSPSAWSALLSSLSQHHLSSLTLSYFRKMMACDLPPSDRTIPCVAKSVGSLADVAVGKAIHGLAVKTPFCNDVFVLTSFVDMYMKCGAVGEARKVFDFMHERNVVSWSALIAGYSDARLYLSAIYLFRDMLVDGLRANDFTFSSVIRVCAEINSLNIGSQIHGLAVKSGLVSSPFVGSALVSLYSKCGLLNRAYQTFDEMHVKNLGAWNSILIASAQHGHTQTVFTQFESLQKSGFRPNQITFLCLLSACSHAGLLDEGQKYFSLMPQHGVKPRVEHYASMVDLLGRVGRISEAVSFIESMPMEPTESVWGALLTACRKYKDADTAKVASDKLIAMGAFSPGMYMLLAGTYRATGRDFEAAHARKIMRDSGLKKETGLSWIEAGGVVHSFVSGDQKHERSVEIYNVLKEVGERMEKDGYRPDISGVDREVRWHSERLAIGLGLLVVPKGEPIRVMKNLRVCNDCHIAIKYLSKCTGRVVILRDNNRFHRFEDGVCNCGDFW